MPSFKSCLGCMMGVRTFNLSTLVVLRPRQEDLWEFETSMVYMVGFQASQTAK